MVPNLNCLELRISVVNSVPLEYYLKPQFDSASRSEILTGRKLGSKMLGMVPYGLMMYGTDGPVYEFVAFSSVVTSCDCPATSLLFS